jgi:hypothetical protein
MRALWRVNLMLALNRSPLNMEYTLNECPEGLNELC